jgi:hypothetical protein
VQLHVSDFMTDAAPPSPEEALGLHSFLLRRDGGLRFKLFLRERNPERVYAITLAIIATLRGKPRGELVTLRELARSPASRPD